MIIADSIAKQMRVLHCHESICNRHASVVRGARPDSYQITRGVREALGRTDVQVARRLLRDRYPDTTRHAILVEYPTVMVQGSYGHRGSVAMRADLSVIDIIDESLIAIVEVGDLSADNKCESWECILPTVAVIWIPKAYCSASRFKVTA